MCVVHESLCGVYVVYVYGIFVTYAVCVVWYICGVGIVYVWYVCVSHILMDSVFCSWYLWDECAL